jgi:CBS domain-containing protein
VRLSELLTPARVVVPLPAKTLEEAVRLLIQACVADGTVTDAARLAETVRRARPEDTVAMGTHAVLPHFRSDAVTAVVAALGICPEPIRPAPKAPRKVRIVLMVIAPPGEAAAYLQAVAAFARALAQPETVAALLKAGSSAEVFSTPGLRDVSLVGPLLVRDLMTTNVVSVAPETPLGEAASLLLQHRIQALPVVGDAREVLGVVSHGELIRYLVPSYVQRVNTGKIMAARRVGGRIVSDPAQLPVREAMNRNVLCLSEDQTIADAATLMANKDIHRFPVVREGVLTGFLTRADIVRKLVGKP